jgi:CubicO group peptidase (beta-lactamase class C family)
MRRLAIALAVAATFSLSWLSAVPLGARQAGVPAETMATQVDRLFEKWDRSDSPGCALGVSERGRVAFRRGYGMANLEYGVRITPDTIFEAGSVSKQFTAAAIVLLAQDGKLSLDDPVRRYLPELPDFGAPIRIRHLLNHTSGLRDQWELLTLAGRPPGQAVHTSGEILELMSRQKELNFPPGDEYLYCNTGYTLLGIIVGRVSGTSLAAFTTERLFKPLGMTRTQWRDDFSRIVKGRATAYAGPRDGTFHADMPFTNVYGNGGLLTTVGDLLKWNDNFDAPKVGGRPLVDQLQTRGRLNDGFTIEYALGLSVTTFGGLREIKHDGATAGYGAFLARFPDERFSIALLCNLASVPLDQVAHRVAVAMLSGRLKQDHLPAMVATSAEEVRKLAGIYREPTTDAVRRFTFENGSLRASGSPGSLIAVGATAFRLADGITEFSFVESKDAGPITLRESDGRSPPRFWESVAPWTPSPADLAEIGGSYYNNELDVTYTIVPLADQMVVAFRPAMRIPIVGIYRDAFGFGGDRVLRFSRDASGRVDGFRLYAGRVRHLRFVRTGTRLGG